MFDVGLGNNRQFETARALLQSSTAPVHLQRVIDAFQTSLHRAFHDATTPCTTHARIASILSYTRHRLNSTYQPPAAAKPNRHGGFYKTFGPTVLKNFLVAMVTFQAIYWSWLKLESMEKKKNGDDEVATLQGELATVDEGEAIGAMNGLSGPYMRRTVRAPNGEYIAHCPDWMVNTAL